MALFNDTIMIKASKNSIFSYKTIPSHWPDYHPLSVEVGPGTLNQTPAVGSEFYEVVNVLGIKQKFIWKVTRSVSPELFEISGTVGGIFGADAVITYTLMDAEGGATSFNRRFEIIRHNMLMKALDRILINRVADYDGKNALKNLKRIMENPAASK